MAKIVGITEEEVALIEKLRLPVKGEDGLCTHQTPMGIPSWRPCRASKYKTPDGSPMEAFYCYCMQMHFYAYIPITLKNGEVRVKKVEIPVENQ